MVGGKSAGRFWAGWLAQACGICLAFMLIALLGMTPGQATLVGTAALVWAVVLVARAVRWATSRRP